MLSLIFEIIVVLLAASSAIMGFCTRILGFSLFGINNIDQANQIVTLAIAFVALAVAIDNQRRINKIEKR